jgi:flagellar biosynthesis protein FlhF
MQVKRYIAEDAHEAMNKIKGEMGQDAVILNTRKIRRKGWRYFFSKPLVEIVAAVEDKPAAADKQPVVAEKQPAAAETAAALAKAPDNTFNGVSGAMSAGIPAGPQNAQSTLYTRLTAAEHRKLKELEEKVFMIDHLMRSHLNEVPQEQNNQTLYPASVQQLYEYLIEQDVNEVYAHHVTDEVCQALNDADNRNESISVRKAAEEVIGQCFGQASPIAFTPGKRKIILFVGPTGIGKTTTLAKLAAIYTLQYKKRVALFTTDTYRIGAAEQLQVYADLLKIPLQVVYIPEEISAHLKKYEDYDLVLIDTSGKNSRDEEHQENIRQLIADTHADQVFLAISATTSFKSSLAILDGYGSLGDYQLILTKLDEAENSGLLLNVRMLFDRPIAYITDGQNVPEDISFGDPRQLTDRLIGRLTISGEDV